MAVTPKKLADGQAASTQSVEYTVPVSTTTIISSATFHNTDTVSRTISLFVQAGVNLRKIFQVALDADATLFFNEKIVLDANDDLVIQGSVENVIDFYISGAEVT